MTIQALNPKTNGDLVLVNILSALLMALIAFFPDSLMRIILGLPFILFFPGYMLICALFPRKEDLDLVERIALSIGLSMAVTSLIGLTLNYTRFGIRLYPTIFSVFSFILLMSAVAIYRRKTISERFICSSASIGIPGWGKKVYLALNGENKIIKTIVIIALIFITLAAILIRNTENKGYEASIYTAIPLLSWVFLIIGIICGICIVVYKVYTKEHEKNNRWVLGLLLILLSNSIILSLPILRGYAFLGRGDPYYHINVILNIISSGQIHYSNFYPIVHIFVTEFFYFSNISPETLFKFIPLFFSIFFVVWMYLFAKSILSNKGQVILATIASTVLIYGWYINFTPNHLSNLMLPLVLFIFFKSTERASHLNVEFKLLLVIVISLYGAYHPVPAIALLFMFIGVEVINKILFTKDLKDPTREFSLTLSLILFVWTITWLSSFYVWGATIRNVQKVVSESAPSALSKLNEEVIYASGYGYSPFKQFLKIYPSILIYVMLALIALIIIIREIRANKSLKNIYLLYGPLTVYFLLTLIFLATNLPFGPFRMVFYILILCTIPVGFVLYRLLVREKHIQKKSKAIMAIAFVIFVLVFSSIHSISILYPSPYILTKNDQMTDSELEGLDWFFGHRDVGTSVYSISLLNTALQRHLLWDLAPYHFNYSKNHTMLGKLYTKDSYMVLNKLDRLLYTEIWPDVAEFRWYASDFEKLQDDASIDKLYFNGEFDVWWINSIGL